MGAVKFTLAKGFAHIQIMLLVGAARIKFSIVKHRCLDNGTK
jgi:hypothetical protein